MTLAGDTDGNVRCHLVSGSLDGCSVRTVSSFNYIMLGSLDWSFATIMFPMGFLTTLVGHVCLLRIVQRYKCPSLVIFSMAIVVLVSAVAMSIESVKELMN